MTAQAAPAHGETGTVHRPERAPASDDGPTTEDRGGHLAVIGMAGRFPGAADIDAFWRNLTAGLDTITREPARPVRAGGPGTATYVPARGLLDGAEWFDAGYFGYSADEALLIDPQQRVFLECALEAMEHAGTDPDRFPGSVGVYGGCTETAYAQTLLARCERYPGATRERILLGTAPDFLAARTADRLGLRGPAITVQSACATVLVAVHLAGQGLLAGDCDLALAGGVAAHVPPKAAGYNEDGILSADGVCRPFDAEGGGTVAANGVGVVVLKRLSDALADGDRVHAVLRGSAVTNDGSGRVGFTAPSIAGQAAAVRAAQLAAGTDAGTISYVETHGTATPLGDPIEMAALTEAFRQDVAPDDRGFCAVGSVKSNIGHADAAAGAAGLIKTVLAVEHGLIPPSLHFRAPNPQIDFGSGPFRVATRLETWRPRGPARRAGVSAFGIGGVNSHVVLEEPPAPAATGPSRPVQLLVLSARTPSALDSACGRLAERLRAAPGLPLADVAWTLQIGRRYLPYRTFVVADRSESAVAALTGGPAASRVPPEGAPGGRPVTFLLPGDSGRPGPGWYLASEPAYARRFDACLDAAGTPLAGAARGAVTAAGGTWPEDPAVHDLCVFAREYALAGLWGDWGVEPSAVRGTGTGALVAAVLAGVLSLPDAVRLVTIAARVAEGQRGKTLGEALRAVPLKPPRVVVLSGHDGRWYPVGQAVDAADWAADWAGRPRPRAASDALPDGADGLVLRLGQGAVLWDRAKPRTAGDPRARHAERGARAVPDTGAPGHRPDGPRRDTEVPQDDETRVMASQLTALGDLWAAGGTVDWRGVHDGARRAKVPLPAYPFERLPYLAEPVAGPVEPVAGPAGRVPAQEYGSGTPEGRAGGRRDVRAAVTAPDGEEVLHPPADGREVSGPAGTVHGGTTPGTIRRLFAQALGLPSVDPEDNFFELGGDSLIAARVLAEVRELFPVDVTAKVLFSAPTAVEFAGLVDGLLSGPGTPDDSPEE
ncbi:beta-ketoacyl synthase N-terminal-like domain-containing protein [Streptomyces sp. NPDC127033]|uniref:beta-ketoacyl synthase N-terminal-like domain-containing protein n=1 Tax=Streptomyces sp. NPDC127033 TaxID=3347110 RepID=UPI003665BF02